MGKPKEESALVTAAAALEDEIRAFADLASQTKRESLDTDRSMSRATRALSDSALYHERIEEKLRALVAAIEGVRLQQQASVEALVAVSHTVELRAKSREAVLARFAELGSNAAQVNQLALELGTRRGDGASNQELFALLTELDARMGGVVSEAQAIAEAASADGWPEIARQADSIRQQTLAAKNKLVLAHRSIAGSAPS
jgi:hypothetical protein